MSHSASQKDASRQELSDLAAREQAFEDGLTDSRPGTAASTGTLDFDSRPGTASGRVLVSAAAQAVKLDEHLRGKLEGAVSTSIDGAVVRDVLFSLAETCKQQATTIDHMRHHMKRMEKKMEHDARHIKVGVGPCAATI